MEVSGITCHEWNLFKQGFGCLRNHIMFPVEKPSMLSSIVKRAMRQHMPEESVSMMDLLNKRSLDKIAESAGACLWKGFVTFGSTNRCFDRFIIVRIIKLIINIIIHGYALHSILDCGYIHVQLHNMEFRHASSSISRQPRQGIETEIRKSSNWKSFQQQKILSLNLLRCSKIIAHKEPHNINIMDEVRSYEFRKFLDRN